MYFLIRPGSQNYCLIDGLQTGCCVTRHENNTTSTVQTTLYISIRALRWLMHHQWAVTFWKKLFVSWAANLNSGLKIFSKLCCKQVCSYPDLVVPLTEPRHRRFSIILRALRFSKWQISAGCNLKSLAVSARNKRISLSSEALKPGTGFSSLAKKVLDGIFFQYKAVLSALIICHLVKSPSVMILGRSSR